MWFPPYIFFLLAFKFPDIRTVSIGKENRGLKQMSLCF